MLELKLNFGSRDLDQQPLSEAELDKLIGERDYKEYLSPRNELYRERNMAEKPPSRADAIKLMSSRGLTVVTPDPKAASEFHAAGSQLASTMRGNMVPADVYDAALQARDAFRKSKGK